jgi:hypothetical protein
LKEIIALARFNNIKMILVYTPEYYENYALILNRKEIFDEYRKIAKDYHVEFWDYSDTPLTHSTEYFYNSQHLNYKGATEFSKMFAAKLKLYIKSQ